MGTDLAGSIVMFLASLAIAFLLFLLVRRLMLWYFKLDLIEKHLSEAVAILRKQASTPRL